MNEASIVPGGNDYIAKPTNQENGCALPRMVEGHDVPSDFGDEAGASLSQDFLG